MKRHSYIGAGNISFDDTQKQILFELLQDLGPGEDELMPDLRNHWAVSLDKAEMILEGDYEESKTGLQDFKQMVADAFGVDVSTIDDAEQDTQYGKLYTFSRFSIDAFRIMLFGGANSTLLESRISAKQYQTDNIGNWSESSI